MKKSLFIPNHILVGVRVLTRTNEGQIEDSLKHSSTQNNRGGTKEKCKTIHKIIKIYNFQVSSSVFSGVFQLFFKLRLSNHQK